MGDDDMDALAAMAAAIRASKSPTTQPPLPEFSVGDIVDVPADTYHQHPALSSTGARRLLKAPALYRWHADNAQPTTPTFDFGKAAHRLVLGDGDTIVEVDADDWRTKTARAARDEAQAAGKVPMLTTDMDTVRAMAAAIRAEPLAAALFEDGEAERSLFWADPDTGVSCRARLDWLRTIHPERRLIIPDYKTAKSAHPNDFRRSAADYGYHVQAAFYLDGIRALSLADDPVFVFVAQEKTPPYLVSVVELDRESMMLGHRQSARAREIYAECVASGRWPGYGGTVHRVTLPEYLFTRELEETSA